MSTDLQFKGDSRRRQLKASQEYAEKHGLDLAEDAQLEDIGISAFKGANIKDGALGQFLKAVEAGTIEQGSYLIVESLDRISRDKILTAQALFLSIIQSGINLVTLMDGRVYRASDVNLGDLIWSLVVMSRAHEESLIKSQRISAAWKNKRVKAASGQPMTKQCPAWLRLSADRKVYEVVSERAEIVRQIFEDCAAGVGMYSIAARLNKAAVPAFVGKNGWHQSYIAKVLSNRSVFGEFQPSRKVEGERIPDGEPIAGYYPKIVSEDLFYRANLAKSQRLQNGKGRKGVGFTNLFTNIAECAYCRANVVFENKGTGPKGGSYLICSGAKRNLGCKATRWRYADFEASFLTFVEELDIESIVTADETAWQRKAISDQLSALQGELAAVNELMEKTYQLLTGGGAVEFVKSKLDELEQRQSRLRSEIEMKSAEQAELLGLGSRLDSSRSEIQTLVKRLQGPTTDELYKTRAQIASRLKVLVQTLLIAPLGDRPKTLKVIEKLESDNDPSLREIIEHLKSSSEHADRSLRYFTVGFHGGEVRAVYPAKKDALSSIKQLEADGRTIRDLPGTDD